ERGGLADPLRVAGEALDGGVARRDRDDAGRRLLRLVRLEEERIPRVLRAVREVDHALGVGERENVRGRLARDEREPEESCEEGEARDAHEDLVETSVPG